MKSLIIKFKELALNLEGATAVEYALMASAIAAVIAVIVFAVGEKTLNLFNAVQF